MISYQWKHVLLLTLGSLVMFPALSPGLTLDEALREALSQHLGLRAEELRLQALQRDEFWSFQAFYPSLTAGLGEQRWNATKNHRALVGLTPQFSGSALTALTPQIYEPEADSLGLRAEVQFTLGLGGFATMAGAKAARAAGEASLADQRATLIAGVKKAFASVLALDLARDLAVRQEEAARQRYQTVESGRTQGTRTEADALQAKAVWSDRTIDRFQAETRCVEARNTLELLMGHEPTGVLPLEGTITPDVKGTAPDEPEPRGDWNARGDLRALEAQGWELDAQVLGALALAVPQVVVGWSFDPGVNGWLTKNLADSGTWSQTNGALSIQLQWKLDSFLPGSKFWTLGSDLDDFRAGLSALRQKAVRDARGEVAKILRSIGDSLRILPLRESEAADARRAAQLSQAAFQAGVQRLVDVQDAEVQAQRAELGLIQERLQLVFAQADLEKALPTEEGNHVR